MNTQFNSNMNNDDWLILNAFLNVPEDVAGRWEKIADAVPGTTAEEVKAYLERLECELTAIESGLVELPSYDDDEEDDEYDVVGDGDELCGKLRKGDESVVSSNSEFGPNLIVFGAGTGSKQKERKRGTPWTVQEHRRFLEGLKIYGRGDWRSISRNIVVTRTATQVASHAQKYFLRQKSEKKEKKRSSIHDMTTEVVDTQPKPPTPPPPPATSVYVPAPPTPSPSHFYSGQEIGVQSSMMPGPSVNFYGGGREATPPLTPVQINFYSGQGREATPLTPLPVSFYGGERQGMMSMQPSNLYGEGQGGGRAQMMGNGFQQNFVYYPF